MCNRLLKHVVKASLASSWGWRTIGPWVRAPGVIVLMYHRILGEESELRGLPVGVFSEQMLWLREHCEPIGPSSLVEYAQQGRRRRPAVLVTFDDGYRDYHDLAYPILKDLGIPSVVFLATSLMDSGGMLWTDEVQNAVMATPARRVSCGWLGGKMESISDKASRLAWAEAARQFLKTLPEEERCLAMEKMLEELGRPSPPQRQMLSWDEVRATRDITVYGGHTHTHPILSRVDRSRAELEIRTCRERILAETGCAPAYFAYPSGRPQDFTSETQALVRECGFTLSFSTIPGIAGPDSDWMALKRIPTQNTGAADLAWESTRLRRR